jgi:UDP-N-acetylmuramyl pentapeptide phosphotransferase/UDP-N-acetylglucosamine-1-phosphate transferase
VIFPAIDESFPVSLIASFALSACVTWFGIRYAHCRNLIDQPGQRRSHSLPTPRGGGIGIVVAALAIYLFETLLLPHEAAPDLLACACAVALVAAVGWIDDHGGLAARWRLLAHFAAALLVLLGPEAGGLGYFASGNSVVYARALVLAIALLSMVWSINLHNFMDGINGLLAVQAIFVFLALAVLAGSVGAGADAWHLCVLSAAVVAFVPFNFPRARVFMGDVGSGALGLLVGVAVLRQMSLSGIAPLSGVVACSAFVADATCNLLSRILRGKRWYSAHREHLYQWMARSGMSHAHVVGWYMGWNLFVVVPVLYAMNATDTAEGGRSLFSAWPWAVGIYAIAFALWIFGKRWCLQKVKSERCRVAGHHAAA